MHQISDGVLTANRSRRAVLQTLGWPGRSFI